MQLHDPARFSQLKTHMLFLELKPTPANKRGEFVFKSIAVRSMKECLDVATCAALAAREDAAAEDRRYSLTMYVKSDNVVYLAPITVEWCNITQRFGPPDDEWEMFLERAVNKTLNEKDSTRIKRMEQLS